MATAQVSTQRRSATRLATLKRRSEFMRIRGGARFATRGFVLEARRRDNSGAIAPAEGARFGFSVSRRVGTAVERNRIRRRLKAAVRDVVRNHSQIEFDYVLIARRAALDAGFASLVSDLVKALARVHAMSEKGTGRRGVHP